MNIIVITWIIQQLFLSHLNICSLFYFFIDIRADATETRPRRASLLSEPEFQENYLLDLLVATRTCVSHFFFFFKNDWKKKWKEKIENELKNEH